MDCPGHNAEDAGDGADEGRPHEFFETVGFNEYHDGEVGDYVEGEAYDAGICCA